MREDLQSPLKGCLSVIIIASAPVIFVGVIWSSHSVFRPGIDRLILRMNYSKDAIESDSLQITGRSSSMTVSNGDVLSTGSYCLYLALSLLVETVGVVCTILVLRKFDRVLFGGKAWLLVVEIWSEYGVRQQPNLDEPGGDWADAAIDLQSRLKKAIDLRTGDGGLMLWHMKEGKFSAILEAHDQLKSRDCLMIVVFHFRSELNRFLAFAGDRIEGWMIIGSVGTAGSPDVQRIVGTAESLVGIQTQASASPSDRDSVCLLADCHPLAAKDEDVIQQLLERPGVRAVFQFVSMDEVPLRTAGAFVEQVLQPTEDQQKHRAFQHRLVDRFVTRARRPYTESSIADISAPSAEEWIEINCTKK